MSYMFDKSSLSRVSQSGFTLIELVLVIIMIGILATTVIPKMFTSSGFDEVGYQSELITKLRSIQLRYMHNSTECTISLSDSKIELLVGDSCVSDAASIYDTTKIVIESNTLSFSRTTDSLSFDTMGRPSGGLFEISIVGGEQSRTVVINEEGYIYASN